jgi:hypothetical protein
LRKSGFQILGTIIPSYLLQLNLKSESFNTDSQILDGVSDELLLKHLFLAIAECSIDNKYSALRLAAYNCLIDFIPLEAMTSDNKLRLLLYKLKDYIQAILNLPLTSLSSTIMVDSEISKMIIERRVYKEENSDVLEIIAKAKSRWETYLNFLNSHM